MAAGQQLLVATQNFLGLVDKSGSYAEALLRHVSSAPGSPPAAGGGNGRKRRRAGSPDSKDRGGQRPEELEMALLAPGTPTQELLPLLKTELRHHQLQGVRWLSSLYTQAQVVGTLCWLRAKGINGPFLIAAHPSQLTSWAEDLCSHLGPSNVVIHKLDGHQSSRDVMHHVCHNARANALAGTSLKDCPAVSVLVPLDLLPLEKADLSRAGFKYIVADISCPLASGPSQQQQLPQALNPPAPHSASSSPAAGLLRATSGSLRPQGLHPHSMPEQAHMHGQGPAQEAQWLEASTMHPAPACAPAYPAPGGQHAGHTTAGLYLGPPAAQTTMASLRPAQRQPARNTAGRPASGTGRTGRDGAAPGQRHGHPPRSQPPSRRQQPPRMTRQREQQQQQHKHQKQQQSQQQQEQAQPHPGRPPLHPSGSGALHAQGQEQLGLGQEPRGARALPQPRSLVPQVSLPPPQGPGQGLTLASPHALVPQGPLQQEHLLASGPSQGGATGPSAGLQSGGSLQTPFASLAACAPLMRPGALPPASLGPTAAGALPSAASAHTALPPGPTASGALGPLYRTNSLGGAPAPATPPPLPDTPLAPALLAALREVQSPSPGAGLLLVSDPSPEAKASLLGICPLLSLVLPAAAGFVFEAVMGAARAAEPIHPLLPALMLEAGMDRAGVPQTTAGPVHRTSTGGATVLGPRGGSLPGVSRTSAGTGVAQACETSQPSSLCLPGCDEALVPYAAGAVQAMSEALGRLRTVISRFVLYRPADSVELSTLRGRSTELNLYDLFASAE